MSTVAARITDVLADRLTQITVANGYSCNAGLRLYRGVYGMDDAADIEAQGPVVVIGPGEAPTVALTDAYEERLQMEMSLTVTALDRPVAPTTALDTCHALLGDLQRAIFPALFGPLRDAGGQVLASEAEMVGATLFPPGPGQSLSAASMDLTVRYFQRRADPTQT